MTASQETHPPCKHCGHVGEDHDEEFGCCRRMVRASYPSPNMAEDCPCPGYEPVTLLDATPMTEIIQ